LYSIACSAATELFPNPLAGNFKTVIKRLKIFGVKRLIMLFIYKSDEYEFERIKLERLNVSHKKLNYHFELYTISSQYLFSVIGREVLFQLKIQFNELIFNFHDLGYVYIVGDFRSINIILSGGPVNKRQ
jgi:hypothetical protein